MMFAFFVDKMGLASVTNLSDLVAGSGQGPIDGILSSEIIPSSRDTRRIGRCDRDPPIRDYAPYEVTCS
jgi:hypothetical protein